MSEAALRQIIAIATAALGQQPPAPPPGESRVDLVTRLYREILGRDPDPAGLAHWVGTGFDEARLRAEFEPYRPRPPVPPPVTPPNSGAVQPSLRWGEVRQQQSHSGLVMAFPIDAWQGNVGLMFTQGQQPASAANVVTEFTVSKAPGVIDPASPYYQRSVFLNNNTMVMPAEARAPGWFINVCWTYPAEPAHGYCGFSLQWAMA